MLPKSIDPIRLCKQGAHFEGVLPLHALPRLRALGDQGDRAVTVEITCDIDENNILRVRGRIQATICLMCQRCNQAMDEAVDATFFLSPVLAHKQTKKLPDPYEALVLQDDRIHIAEMIEDEVLLALPMVSRHADINCR